MPKLQEYPDQVYEGDYKVNGLVEMRPDLFNRWYLLRVKSRQEMCLATDLQAKSIAYHLPMIEVRGNRQNLHQTPLFPGYMFLYGTTCHRYDSLKTNRISQIIDVEAQSQLYWDLICIDLAISRGYSVRTTSLPCKGDICSVYQGALKGMVGKVAYTAADKDLWVGLLVKTLGQVVLVKIPKEDVQVISSHPDAVDSDLNSKMVCYG
jgi:hypothetical protein